MTSSSPTLSASTDPLRVAPRSDTASARKLTRSVDAGDNEALAEDAADLDGDEDLLELLPFDLDGLPRRIDDPAVPDSGNGRAPIVDIGRFERQG